MKYLLYLNNDLAGADNNPFALADQVEQCTGLIINRKKLADDINRTGEFLFALGAWKIMSVIHSNSTAFQRAISVGVDGTITRMAINN